VCFSIKVFLAISCFKGRKQPRRGISGYIVVKYEFSWESGDVDMGRNYSSSPYSFPQQEF
jgi:hypothetical protein